MNMTENFSLQSMIRSQTATRLGIDNEPSLVVVSALSDLCVNVLQPLRDELGVPVFVSSGFRCIELNKAIRGADGSQHTFGQAGDIIVPGMTPSQVASVIMDLDLPVDQCIVEWDEWTHVSFSARHRREFLIRDNSGYTIMKDTP